MGEAVAYNMSVARKSLCNALYQISHDIVEERGGGASFRIVIILQYLLFKVQHIENIHLVVIHIYHGWSLPADEAAVGA